MRNIIKNKGLIIKTFDYLENAVLANVLTKNGKVAVVIKGAKKLNTSTRRLGNVLTLIEFSHTDAKNVSTLTEGVVLDNYTDLKDDLLKYNYALVLLEKIYYFSEYVSDFETLFNFTINLLNLLKTTKYLNAVKLIFEIKLLYLLGVAPSFKRCPICDKNITSGVLDIKNGGFLCNDCRITNDFYLNESDSLLFKKIYVTKLLDVNEEFLRSINNHQNINNCIKLYYEWHLEFKSKVLDIIEKIG